MFLNRKNEAEITHINAIIAISMLVLLNIASIPLLIMAILGTESIPDFHLPSKLVLFISFIIYSIVQYFLLAYNKKYLKIYSEFNNESEKRKKWGVILTRIYILISIGIPLYIFFFSTPS